MLDRLKGMVSSLGSDESEEEILPTFDFPMLPPPPAEVPVAQPVEPIEAEPAEAPLLALPAEAPPIQEALVVPPTTPPVAEPPPVPPEPSSPESVAPVAPFPETQAQTATLPPCPVCGSDRALGQLSCADCGYFFPADGGTPVPTAAPVGGAAMRLKQRYELGELIAERNGVSRYRARDLGLSGTDNVPVIVIREKAPEVAPAAVEPLESGEVGDDEILPGFDDVVVPTTEVLPRWPQWPSVAWEMNLLDTLQQPGLPAVLDRFTEDGWEYLVEELPTGQILWDAWDDPDATASQRFDLLAQVAETMQMLHRGGAMLEGIRPDIVVVTDQGRARLADLSDLLPLAVPVGAPLRAGLATAPELLSSPQSADARADLYSFGGMLYALHVGRELSGVDFDKPGQPKPFIPRFPDVHPVFGRLIHKTFVKPVEMRFPTDEAVREDPSGFSELIRTLHACGRVMDNVRLEVAAWTTTGMVRTGNEDAYALLVSSESRQEDFADSALLLLADGMGGYEAGEVAATMTLQALRKSLTALKPFSALAGGSGFVSDLPQAEGNALVRGDVEELKGIIKAALKDANKQVFNASRSGVGRRGMGCTAEAVYVDGRNVIVGHVGDSRTYHLSGGRLVQLTRDQTLVSRLVELGTLTEEEAETHPRRNELQQAVGGQPEVDPGISHAVLRPGDYLIVCSDGVSNHIKSHEFAQFLLGDDGVSAERAARRLVNLVNIEGATDNATVVVVRIA
jgi:serine/threonine protein phosphatase PrpC